MAELNDALTDVPGLLVGHAHDEDAITGCTVILCPDGATAGFDQRGGAPGTRETDLLRPMRLVQKVHAVLLTGGSAYGLDAAGGVMRYLEERRIGFDVRVAKVPIVPAAVIFDLDIGRVDVRPDAAMGYAACEAASDDNAEQGCVGAGIGAKVGGLFGVGYTTKSGLGTSSVALGEGVVVAALMVVNAFGDVVDGQGRILAGARKPPEGDEFADTLKAVKSLVGQRLKYFSAHTVIGVVATNVALTKEEANKVAQMAHDGVARAIRPAHTMLDGDTIFALSLGDKVADVSLVGAYAAEVTTRAVINAVLKARPMGGLPTASSVKSA